MELRHLRYLIAVAEEQSFVAAAARLALAQPALSRQIRDLEKEIGVDLFTRDSSGTRLTAAGDVCVRKAREILEDLKASIERARQAEHGLVGRCVLAAGRYPLWNGLLGRLVEHVKWEYPGIEIIVDERSLRSQWEALAACHVDIAFGTAPPTEYMQFVVETHSLDIIDSIAVAKTHPLAQRESVQLADLAPHTWLRHAPSVADEPTRILHSVLASRDFTPHTSRYAANDDALRMLVRAGAGWSALPRSLRAVLPDSIAAIPVEDMAVPFRYVHFHRRGDNRPIVRSVLGALRRASRKEGYAPTSREPDSGIKAVPAAKLAASRIELRHLRYFVATIEHETIGRAAEFLGITQPALSRQLRDLEEEVDASLINRTPRGIVPNLSGEILCADATRILRAADQMAVEAHRAQRGIAGRCVLGVSPTPLIWDVVTRSVAACAKDAPTIEAEVEDVPSPIQALALNEGRIDIGLGHRHPGLAMLDRTVQRMQLLPDTLNSALLASTHPLASRSSITLADLADVPLLFMRRAFNPRFYDEIMSQFARSGFTPRIEAEHDGLPTVWALAAQGLGWCIAAESQHEHTPSGLRAVRITDFALPWNCDLTYRKDESRPAVLEMIRFISEAAHAVHDESMASQETKYWPQRALTG
jgi:DNA-binding transcriptional LysR family regulator